MLQARQGHWPGDGIVVNGRLLVFLMKIHATKTGLGFEAFGWAAVAIDNPHDEPSRWRVRWLNVPANDLNVVIGSASLLRAGDFVYAFSVQEPAGQHDVYLVRWPVDRAAKGYLREPFWWCGGNQWVKQTQLKQKPVVVFSEAQTEFTVHFDSTLKRYIQIQTVGFGAASMALRSSSEITGPWSGLEPFYRPPGVPPDIRGHGLGLSIARGLAEAQGGSLVYAARAGGGSVLTLTLPATDMPSTTPS